MNDGRVRLLATVCASIAAGSCSLLLITVGAIVASRGSEGLGASLLALGLLPAIYYIGSTKT